MTAPTNSISSPYKINAEVFEDAPMTPIDQKTNETWKKSTPALAEGIRPTSSQVVFKDEKTIEELEEEIDKLEAIEKLLKALESAVLKVDCKTGKGIEEIKKIIEVVSKDEKTIEEATKLLEEASVITGINKDKKIIEVKKDEAIGFFQNFGRQALEVVKFTRDLSIIAAIGGTLLILFFPPAREKFCVVVGKILLKIVVPVIDLGIEKLESSVKA